MVMIPCLMFQPLTASPSVVCSMSNTVKFYKLGGEDETENLEKQKNYP